MPNDPLHRLPQLYADMEGRYSAIAAQIDLSCAGCPDNCCTSFFQHHTHVEWAYLWQGLAILPEKRLQEIRAKAKEYVQHTQRMLTEQRVPDMMCPLNENGRCILYTHRMMICRLHGVPNAFMLPNGVNKEFPGCFRAQELVGKTEDRPILDRTDVYRRLAELEMDFIRSMPRKPARVRLTLAEMIQQGPPI